MHQSHSCHHKTDAMATNSWSIRHSCIPFLQKFLFKGRKTGIICGMKYNVELTMPVLLSHTLLTHTNTPSLPPSLPLRLNGQWTTQSDIRFLFVLVLLCLTRDGRVIAQEQYTVSWLNKRHAGLNCRTFMFISRRWLAVEAGTEAVNRLGHKATKTTEKCWLCQLI